MELYRVLQLQTGFIVTHAYKIIYKQCDLTSKMGYIQRDFHKIFKQALIPNYQLTDAVHRVKIDR